RHLILRHADTAPLQILWPLDAVSAHIDRVVAERARRKYRHADIRTIAIGSLHCEAAHRQFAHIELAVPEAPQEDFLRLQCHEHRIGSIDLHAAIDQRPYPVVIADCDGESELAHSAASLTGANARSSGDTPSMRQSSVFGTTPSNERSLACGI